MLAAEGEAYREALIEQARRIGVAGLGVASTPPTAAAPALTALIQSAAVVVLPYDSTDQVTSGVLVDAIASGRPVVATAFPHAVELLGSGAGIVVDHDDPDALVAALRRLLTDPRSPAAWPPRPAGWPRRWPGRSSPTPYLALAQRLVADRRGAGMTAHRAAPVFDHLLRMTDHRGTFEHACLTEPRREHGYCTDDMARVLVVATREPDPDRQP